MTKILNIDSLAKEKRELSIDGKTYPMKELSVKDFVELTKRAEKAEKAKGDSPASRIDFLVETVGMNFPSCPREVLEDRTIEELNIMFNFAKDGVLPGELIAGKAVKKMEKQD